MTRRRRPRRGGLHVLPTPVRNLVAAVCPALLRAAQTGMVERRPARPADLNFVGHPSSLTVTTQTPGGASRLQPIHAPGTAQED